MQAFLDYFTQLHPIYFILLVFLGYFIENLFPPLPGDTLLVLGAYIFGLKHETLWSLWLYFGSVAGAISGFMLMVWLGRRFGRDFFIEKNYKYASRSFFIKVDKAFQRYGWGVILWNRLFFGLRPVIGLAAGVSEMRKDYIFLLVTLSALVFNALFMLMGYLLGNHWSLITGILQKYTIVTIMAAVLLILLFIRSILRRKR
jgi:membrane protein DedA with SNARE-associated domain